MSVIVSEAQYNDTHFVTRNELWSAAMDVLDVAHSEPFKFDTLRLFYANKVHVTASPITTGTYYRKCVPRANSRRPLSPCSVVSKDTTKLMFVLTK
jgi:hypothetical protein